MNMVTTDDDGGGDSDGDDDDENDGDHGIGDSDYDSGDGDDDDEDDDDEDDDDDDTARARARGHRKTNRGRDKTVKAGHSFSCHARTKAPRLVDTAAADVTPQAEDKTRRKGTESTPERRRHAPNQPGHS